MKTLIIKGKFSALFHLFLSLHAAEKSVLIKAKQVEIDSKFGQKVDLFVGSLETSTILLLILVLMR